MSDERAAETATAEQVGWRELAVARSLDSARTRAENRVQRFLDAALDLMYSSDNNDFTVQDVVERSGQSLRSFYQYFGGKHELLLALLEDAIAATADHLRGKLGRIDDPGDRLHRFVVEYFRLCQPPPKKRTTKEQRTAAQSTVLVEFAQQLLTKHPTEAARAFAPIVQLFDEVYDQALEAGTIRPGLERSLVAGVVLETVMFNAFSATIAGAPVGADAAASAEALWDVLFRGLAASPTT